SELDRQAIADYVADFDGVGDEIDGEVDIADFARNFSVYDLNYDGVVDADDVDFRIPDPDSDDDADVDLSDFAAFQRCFGNGAAPGDGCGAMNLDLIGEIELEDYGRFLFHLTGPISK
ncbi:MAG: hypothetical protein AABZ12_08890, partial [Planctomycetota bacterium]